MLFDKTKKIAELEEKNRKLEERLVWYSNIIKKLQIELTYANAENYELKKKCEKVKKKDLTFL